MFWILAVIVAMVAAVTDFRGRRIPNWLTVSSFLLGFIVNAIVNHWHGLKMSAIGAGICLGVLLPFVIVRALGAGDWKLMGALGAILGPTVLLVLLATTVIAGIMALFQVISKRRIRETLSNMWLLVKLVASFGLKGRSSVTLDSPGASSIPYGVAAAMGTIACFVTILFRAYVRV